MNQAQFLNPPRTIADIESFVVGLVDEVNEGREYALDVFVAAKRWQRTIEAVISNIEKQAVEEAGRQGKRFSHNGASVEVRELGARWFYDKCNDPIFNSIAHEKNLITEREKERQGFLKSLKEAVSILDEDTGEVIRVVPPRKESKTGVVVTLS
jgi:hypothetical protein